MKTILVLLILTFSSQILESQIVREARKDQALMFDMSSLDESLLSNYNFGLGYRYYIRNDFSFSLSIGFNNTNRDNTFNDTTFNNEINFIGINPAIRYNFSSNKNIIAFIGIDGSYMIESSLEDDSFNKIESNNSVISAGIFLGAEWFFIENLSLTAQYRLGYGISDLEEKLNGSVINTDSETRLQLGMNEFKLGLSLFFN